MIAKPSMWIALILLAAGIGRSSLALSQQAPAAAKTAEVYTAWPFDAKEAANRQQETAKTLGIPKEKTVDLGGGVTIDFILIPAGTYGMGEAPGTATTIEKPFYVGKFHVTQAQYQRVIGKNPSGFSAPSNPVDTVSWSNASAFSAKVSELTKNPVRLPQRKEWEWACRAGTATRCYWGDDMTHMGDYCWWHDNCNMKTHPVGQKKPNAFGLYDMMGLLWQWCSDGGPDVEKHSTCGATFGSKEPMFKSSVSIDVVEKGVNDRFGFRVAMDVN